MMVETSHAKAVPRHYKTLGFVGRFKPLHLGAYALLSSACEQAEQVIVGIGSTNKYNLRNPFYADEVAGMIDAALRPSYANYRLVFIPDFAQNPQYVDGTRWASEVVKMFGPLDAFVSGNPFVQRLLQEHYRIIEPVEIIPRERWIRLRATEVRVAMALGDSWTTLVPPSVAQYLGQRDLVSRFRRVFGLQTLSLLASGDAFTAAESAHAEYLHAQERST